MDSLNDESQLSLPISTLTALREFQADQEAEKARFAALQARAQDRFAAIVKDGKNVESIPTIDEFKEDWQLSQFWYSDQTALALAHELIADGGSGLRIGVLCAPSVYPALLKSQAEDVWLFEYDTRFEVLAGKKFVKYDYNHPMQFPEELRGSFDRLIIDPPFLSDECEVKAAITARALGKQDVRYIVCSGSKMRDLCMRLYNAKETRFQVEHKDGRLSNDFMCLLNYQSTNQTLFTSSS